MSIAQHISMGDTVFVFNAGGSGKTESESAIEGIAVVRGHAKEVSI